MGDYTTVAKIQEYLPQVTDTTLLASILTRASRLVDRLCWLEDDFFAAASGSAAQIYIGTGIQMLKLKPYVAASLAATGAVTVEDITDTIEYRVRDSRFLLRYTDTALWDWGEPQDYDYARRGARRKPVWPMDKRVTVTANWGWSAVPDDVVNATIELSGVIYRQHPELQLSLDTGDAQVEEAALPERARLLAQAYAHWRDLDTE